jgi:hypothetical protein
MMRCEEFEARIYDYSVKMANLSTVLYKILLKKYLIYIS